MFLSDFHVPHHNIPVVESALRLIKKIRPHRVVLNGDMNDHFQLSRFNNTGERLETLQDEIDGGNRIRGAVRKAVPDALIEETEGNHDSRLRGYVAQNAAALKSLRALLPEEQYHWKRYEITPHTGAGFRLRPNFLVKHGTHVRGEAGATAKAEMAAAGISGISGHTHRLATYRKVGYQTMQWTEQGCLCRLDPEYITGMPNWTNGVVVGQFSTRSDCFVVEEVQAFNDKLVYGGKSV